MTTTLETSGVEMLNTSWVVETRECLVAQTRCSFFEVLVGCERVGVP